MGLVIPVTLGAVENGKEIHFVKKKGTDTKSVDIPPASRICELMWPGLTATEGGLDAPEILLE